MNKYHLMPKKRAGLTRGSASFEASTPRFVATASIAWILAVTAAAATADALEERELITRELGYCNVIKPGHGLWYTPSTKVSVPRWGDSSTYSKKLSTKVKQVHAADRLLNCYEQLGTVI